MSKRTCTITDCGKPHLARGWCRLHYKRWQAHGDPLWVRPIRLCRIAGCGDCCVARELCSFHYARLRRYGDPLREPAQRLDECEVEGCELGPRVRGLCRQHYSKLLRHGDPTWARSPKEPCSRPGCDVAASTDGLCRRHFLRAYTRRRTREAKAEGRCTWMSGIGCDLPADDGFSSCAEHRAVYRFRHQKRRQAMIDVYAARGLVGCWMCGRPLTASGSGFHHDHLIPRSLGGPDADWNLAPACGRCNVRRRAMPLLETVALHYPEGIPQGAVADAVNAALQNFASVTGG